MRQEKRLGDALDEQYLYSLISFTAATLQLSNEHVPGLVLQHLRVGKQSSLLSSIGVPLGQGETVPTSEAASFLLAVHQSRSSAAFRAHRHLVYCVRRKQMLCKPALELCPTTKLLNGACRSRAP